MSRKGSTATFGGGLNQDVDPVQIPDGDYLFALNAQSDGGIGEKGVISSELGTKIASAIPKGYILIGHCYMREGEIALFLVNPDEKKGSSQIGIFDVTGKYTSHVNFKNLNFRVDNPIECIFRIRKGCERTIYWVEKNGGNPPRYFIFDKPNYFKYDDGRWNHRKFLIQRSYDKPPVISHCSIITGGQLEAGSYSIAIQLVNESLIPSEWIFSTGRINIYHSNLSEPYPVIRGSLNTTHNPLNFGKTNKSIHIKVTDVDKSFRYYRLAFIRCVSGNKRITDIRVTDYLDISIPEFVYNGFNTVGTIPLAELLVENNLYDGADTIEQSDKRLILGNVRRVNINWCRLQYYASRITADCVTQKVDMNSNWDPNNPKNPTVDMGNTGYMPGEIYSFGIVYLFEGGIKSPVYHIPGKPKYIKANTVFNAGKDVYPMSNNNICKGKFYATPTPGFNYWGNDSQGKPLEGNPVRHHRFPTRAEIGKPLVTTNRRHRELLHRSLKAEIKGTLNFDYFKNVSFKISYKHNKEVRDISLQIVPAIYDDRAEGTSGGTRTITDATTGPPQVGNDNSIYEEIRVSYAIGDSEFVEIDGVDFGMGRTSNITLKVKAQDSDDLVEYEGFKNVTIAFKEDIVRKNNWQKTVTTDILGIQFGNIDLPTDDDTNGYTCIGYYIVRNERTEQERTIIDTGILLPTSKVDRYVGFGLVNYEHTTGMDKGGQWDKYWNKTWNKDEWFPGGTHFAEDIYDRVYALYYPSMHFEDRKINDMTRIRVVGDMVKQNVKYGYIQFNDVMDGSSLPDGKKGSDFDKDNDDIIDDGGVHDNRGATGGKDDFRPYDGIGWACFSRDADYDYRPYKNGEVFNKSDIFDIYYMKPMDHRSEGSRNEEIYNLCANHSICLINLKNHTRIGGDHRRFNRFDYVTPLLVQIERDNPSPYFKFDILPYHSETTNYYNFNKKEDNKCVVFGGDSYVGCVRNVYMVYNIMHFALRNKSLLALIGKWFGVAFLTIASIVAVAVTGGASLIAIGAAITLAGGALLMTKSAIDSNKAVQIWNEEYDKGLRKCANDRYFGSMISRHQSQDSYIRMEDAPDPRNKTNGRRDKGKWGQERRYGVDGFSDDTIVWNADCISDMYFESHINVNLKNGFINDTTPIFMDAPSQDGEPNRDRIKWWGIKSGDSSPRNYRKYYIDSVHDRHPHNALEHYIVSIILTFDQTRRSNKKYFGVPLTTYNNINPDYMANHKAKAFFFLNRDYDCSSACQNLFKNRIIWSEVSDEESASDNYKKLLPNNYVDMDASAGDIKRIIKFNNELHVFTTEALWKIPNAVQERVNDGVVTYIGSGEFLSVPARRIVDSNTGVGGGCIHSFSIIKTPYGLCYVSYTDRRVYLLQGNTLKPISDIGMSSWFKENIRIITDEDYFKNNTKIYRFRDNTFASIGTGFALGYDNLNNRLLVSKKDRVVFSNRNGYIITTDGNERYIFYDYENTIDNYVSQGWEYLGITGIKMRFRRFKENTGTKTVKVKKTRKVQKVIREPQDIFKAADILLIRYTIIRNPGQGTGGGLDTRSQILDPEDLMEHPVGWYDGKPEYYTRKIDKYWAYGGDWKPDSNANSFGGTDVFAINLGNIRKDRPSIESVSWNCAAYWFTPANGSKVKLVFTTYKGGELGFGHDYTLTVTGGQKLGEFDHPDSKGREVTDDFHEQSQVPFEQMTYLGKFQYNINTGTLYDITNPKGYIEVGKDGSGTTTVMVEKTVEEEEEYYDNETLDNNKLVPDFMEITADPLTDKVVDNSWTASYSFGKNRWISFHSYLPNTYITTADKMFSMIDNNRNIYEHNILGKYNSYYDQKQQHILEFVCKTESMLIGVFDSITLNTDALRFNNNAFYDARLITFNKAILYNGRQCSGVLELRPKQDSISDYIYNISNNNPLDVSSIERREKDWNINEFSDIRTNYDTHIWSSYLIDRQNNYFIDKVLNFGSLDYNKHWTELERFRDRYIIIRLIFDTHDDVRLITRMCSTNIVY